MADSSGGPILIQTHAQRAEREQAEENRRENQRRQLQLWFNGILMFATISTAIFVGYQNYLLRLTLDQTRKQSAAAQQSAIAALWSNLRSEVIRITSEDAVKETLRQMEIQNQSMKEVASAATKSSRTSERALEISQRSELFFTNPSQLIFELGKTPVITLWIANTGHIPATVFELSSGYFVGLERELPKPDQFPIAATPSNFRVPPIGKGIQIPFELRSFNDTVPKVGVESIQNSRAYFWFYVKCRYRDYFGIHRSCTLFKHILESNQLVIDGAAAGYDCAD
jgi:hypothetical protein